MAALGVIAGTLALFIGLESVQAVLDHVVGDPEADVTLALQQLARTNQRRAFAIEAGEQLGREDVERSFAGFNEIPRQALSSASLLSSPLGPRLDAARDTSTLDFVSQSMGVDPDRLRRASAPQRSGDMSGMLRSLGRDPSGG